MSLDPECTATRKRQHSSSISDTAQPDAKRSHSSGGRFDSGRADAATSTARFYQRPSMKLFSNKYTGPHVRTLLGFLDDDSASSLHDAMHPFPSVALQGNFVWDARKAPREARRVRLRLLNDHEEFAVPPQLREVYIELRENQKLTLRGNGVCLEKLSLHVAPVPLEDLSVFALLFSDFNRRHQEDLALSLGPKVEESIHIDAVQANTVCVSGSVTAGTLARLRASHATISGTLWTDANRSLDCCTDLHARRISSSDEGYELVLPRLQTMVVKSINDVTKVFLPRQGVRCLGPLDPMNWLWVIPDENALEGAGVVDGAEHEADEDADDHGDADVNEDDGEDEDHDFEDEEEEEEPDWPISDSIEQLCIRSLNTHLSPQLKSFEAFLARTASSNLTGLRVSMYNVRPLDSIDVLWDNREHMGALSKLTHLELEATSLILEHGLAPPGLCSLSIREKGFRVVLPDSVANANLNEPNAILPLGSNPLLEDLTLHYNTSAAADNSEDRRMPSLDGFPRLRVLRFACKTIGTRIRVEHVPASLEKIDFCVPYPNEKFVLRVPCSSEQSDLWNRIVALCGNNPAVVLQRIDNESGAHEFD